MTATFFTATNKSVVSKQSVKYGITQENRKKINYNGDNTLQGNIRGSFQERQHPRKELRLSDEEEKKNEIPLEEDEKEFFLCCPAPGGKHSTEKSEQSRSQI